MSERWRLATLTDTWSAGTRVRKYSDAGWREGVVEYHPSCGFFVIWQGRDSMILGLSKLSLETGPIERLEPTLGSGDGRPFEEPDALQFRVNVAEARGHNAFGCDCNDCCAVRTLMRRSVL
jgi:hypothetical protein